MMINAKMNTNIKQINVNLHNRAYPIYIGTDLLAETGVMVSGMFKPGRVLLVSDRNVYNIYGEWCLASLCRAGFQVFSHIIAPGENSKNMDSAVALYDAALEAGLDRLSPVAALGGGVVGDLAGFVAATYIRGVPFIQLPTTLLAQVDSSVGGKVGINHSRGKNLIGAFYQPAMVMIDLSALQTLPSREYQAGLGEVLKYALLGGSEIFNWLEDNIKALISGNVDIIKEAVTRSILIKAEVVEADEREKGLRRILNLGHTFGHALEAATGYGYYLHGEAVVAGMNMALTVACETGLIADTEADRIRSLLSFLPLKLPPGNLKVSDITERINYDKKKVDDTVNFVLPVRAGSVVIKPGLPGDVLHKVVAEYLMRNIT